MAGHHTFFEYAHWWSGRSIAQDARFDSMFRTLDVGTPWYQRAALRIGAEVGNFLGWLGTLTLAAREIWRYPVFGPGVGDHHSRPIEGVSCGGAHRANVACGGACATGNGTSRSPTKRLLKAA